MCTIHCITLCTCISDVSDIRTNYITNKVFTMQTATWEYTILLFSDSAVFLLMLVCRAATS